MLSKLVQIYNLGDELSEVCSRPYAPDELISAIFRTVVRAFGQNPSQYRITL
jgi:hypothetical protein